MAKLTFKQLEFEDKGDFVRVSFHGLFYFDVDKNETIQVSYRELRELVFETANFLWQEGIKKDDRFGILMNNCIEVLVFELAGAVIGAATVPLDYRKDTLERKIYKLKFFPYTNG